MLVLRALRRVIGVLLMLALALLGLGVALYCLDGFIRLGSVRPDRLLHLSDVRRHVGHFLEQIAAPGPTAGLALLCGIGAMLLGLAILVGTLRSSRQRLAVLDTVDGGTLAVRPRTLRAMAGVLAERADGATAVKRPRIALSRHGTRGRLKVTASRSRTAERQAVEQAIRDRLAPISQPFNLRPRVRVRSGERGERVQ